MNPWIVASADLVGCSLVLAALIGARIIYDRRNPK